MSNGIQTMRGAAEQGIAADVQSANSALQQIATINGQVAKLGGAFAPAIGGKVMPERRPSPPY